MLPNVFGDKTDIASLSAVRAQTFATALAQDRVPGAQLVSVHHHLDFSTLQVKLDVAVSQLSAVDIRAVETIAISFRDGDQYWPEVYALRPDFPRDLPHLTSSEAGFPVGLCISEDPFDEAKAHWTPISFIRRLQSWFERAADETLHAEDQELEPFIMRRDGELIVPHSLMTSTGSIPVHAYELGDSKVFFLEGPEVQRQTGRKPVFACARLITPPQQHGVRFFQLPRTLESLIDRFEEFGWKTCRDDIIKQVRSWMGGNLSSYRPLFLVTFPLLRNKSDKTPEKYNTWAFASSSTIENVAIDLGLIVREQGFTGPLIGLKSTNGERGQNTPICHLNPRTTLSPAVAASYNGLDAPPSLQTVVIGAGALGSQVLSNAMRAGFLPTHIVDMDRMMPHNVARHALGHEAVGYEKAMAMKTIAATLVDSNTYPEAIVADILRPEEKEAKLLAALEGAELIIDMSASLSVSAALVSDVRYTAPRVSMFLNPSGSDLIVLAEDNTRAITLDQIEAQYYGAVVKCSGLDRHK